MGTHMGEDNQGHNRAYLKQGTKWFLCEDYNLPVEKSPVDNLDEQNYCLLLKKCNVSSAPSAAIPLRKCSVVIDQLPKQIGQQSYANTLHQPSNKAPRKACSLENVYVEPLKESLKRSFSSSESIQSTDAQHEKQPVDCCKGCKKPFTRLFYHLTKSSSCSKLNNT